MQTIGNFLPLCNKVLYFPSSREPLSSDIFLIMTERFPILFDVGNGSAALSAALFVKDPVVVLSHFHADHVGNIAALSPSALYLTRFTQKHTVPGTVVTASTEITDGITVFPFPNSHSKGSLALKAGSMLFIGDALYPGTLNERACYNTGLLREEIDFIKQTAPTDVIVSHRKNPVVSTAAVLAFLEGIYRLRAPNETYIFTKTPFSGE